jgi:BirA family transcriptional regulator, biotin operon repressor / biotin---[acetyl-CoA-carboxylase] ligase
MDAQDVPTDVARAMAGVAARAHGLGSRIHWLRSTSSTNDVAARLAESGAEEGTTVVAETQTAGRGQHGRVWVSPPMAGLYVSVIVRPEAGTLNETNPVSLLTLGSGVAIAEAVRAVTGLPAQIKWPNDVLVGGRKLAGILAESAVQGGALQFIVIGFGVNLEPAAYPPDLASRVTSIEAETSRPVDRALMFAEIMASMGERYADLRAGRFDAILSAWDIDGHGALLVRVAGTLQRVVAGEVRWL